MRSVTSLLLVLPHGGSAAGDVANPGLTSDSSAYPLRIRCEQRQITNCPGSTLSSAVLKVRLLDAGAVEVFFVQAEVVGELVVEGVADFALQVGFVREVAEEGAPIQGDAVREDAVVGG